MKIKWRVDANPTGMYRSFHKRGWPSAEDDHGRAVAAMFHPQSYTATLAKNAEGLLRVKIADWTNGNSENRVLGKSAFEFFTPIEFTHGFHNVKAAKEAVAKFLKHNPQYLPKENV